MKDNLWWFLLLIAAVLLFNNVVNAGEWNEKPVMCEQKEIFEKIMVDRGEILFSQGDSLATVRDPDEANGLSPIPATLPLKVYVNLETKTYTITETHPSYGQMCILSYGENFSSILLDTM